MCMLRILGLGAIVITLLSVIAISMYCFQRFRRKLVKERIKSAHERKKINGKGFVKPKRKKWTL